MAKKPEVICIYCNKRFQREEGNFEPVGARRYAHKECYDMVQELQSLLGRKLGESHSPTKVNNQINQLVKDGYDLEDICDTMYWWYEINHGDASKANGGIGIFSYVYPDFIKYKEHKREILSLNKNESIEDYIEKGESYIIHPTPIRRPRVKLFKFE